MEQELLPFSLRVWEAQFFLLLAFPLLVLLFSRDALLEYALPDDEQRADEACAFSYDELYEYVQQDALQEEEIR